ncbi:hypothetical protein B0H14DRAFT_3501705 [Mycena olivaceomarginata]|nr:hypothetical protein B0H14DRAFT_3501705 [Mycena olivaceomarginata]
MAITESQKSLTAKPGPKPGQKPGTAARFRKDERHQDLTYHDWVQTQRTTDPPHSQTEFAAYFSTPP